MFSKLKIWLMGALTFLAGLFAFLWKASQLRHARDKLKGEQQARETERKANDALVDGITKEQEAIENVKKDIATGKRNHFE